MYAKKWRKTFASVLLASVGFGAYAQTTLPPVVVTAPRVGGGTIVCRGTACALVIAQLRQTIMDAYLRMQQPVPDPEDIPLSKSKVCSKLNARRPANCSFNNPPSSPGITVPGQASWQPSGCGTGPLANEFSKLALNVLYPAEYSGDLNAPFYTPNGTVSFLAACNAHDQCWGEGNDRTWCDQGFRAAMQSQCDTYVSNTTAWGTCSSMVSAYHTAVSNSQATSHYNESFAQRQCAMWASDMRENGCSP